LSIPISSTIFFHCCAVKKNATAKHLSEAGQKTQEALTERLKPLFSFYSGIAPTPFIKRSWLFSPAIISRRKPMCRKK